MDYSKLENNIIDVMKEEQLKLGYCSETVRLYYPLSSLNRFLDGTFDADQMMHTLGEFAEAVKARLGMIEISRRDDRFCFAIPPQGADYVHAHMEDAEFICDFIKTVGNHGCTMDDVLRQFYKYSDHVHVEKVNHGEFDYLVYFEDGKPDDFRYCITDEGCHIIYHRYTIDDYNDFGFERE